MNALKRKRTLQAFKSGDEKQLWNVTKELFEIGFFNCYLTSQQFNLLKILLYVHSDKESENILWASFMNGSLILRFKEDAGDDSNSNENMYMKPGYPTLRNLNGTIRYLLYEKAIDYYYFKHNDEDKEFQLLENTFAEEIDDTGNNSSNIVHDPSNYDKTKNQKASNENEDDDYDDEDDDYDEEEEKVSSDQNQKIAKNEIKNNDENKRKDCLIVDDATKDYVLLVSKEELLKKPVYPSVPELSEDEEAIGKLVHPILGTSSAIESSIEKQNELKLIKSFNKIYHNFENDLPNIHKKRKLERSDKQLEMSDNVEQNNNISEDSDSKQVNKLITLGGAANLSLKNLLNKIEDNRDKLGVTDVELKNLIMDVRKNRSKWANYNKIGQEELYEACEKVVTELRGYTEHSTPFLNRVSKREAPNYYQIIKKPMDLNTVLKKLKTLQYQKKKEFVDDLMLIWQNCLTYNSDPKHFIRVDAMAMRKKTLTLIPLIPDITIRDRAEVEKEAAELAMKEQEKDETFVGRTSTRGMGHKTSKKGRKGTSVSETTPAIDSPSLIATPKEDSIVEIKEEEETPVPKTAPLSIPSSVTDRVLDDQTSGNTPSNIDEDDEDDDMNMDDENSRKIYVEDLNEDNDDLEISTWKTLTSTTRYKLCNERSKLFKENKIQPNTEAPIRTKIQMYNFCKYLEDESKLVLHRNRKYLDENDDPYLIEYDVAGGVPNIKHKNIDFDKIEEDALENMISEGKTLDDLPDSGMKVKLQGSNGLILENISLMQDIRKTCFKINLIRTMQTSQFVHQSQFVAPSFSRIKFEDIDPMSKLKTRDLMTENIASQSLQKSVSALVMLNGFESTTPSCARLLTQIAEVYMSNLAKSLKLHLESKSINKMPINGYNPISYKDILQIVLKYNGVDKPDVIYSFYKEQLTKQNKKLIDLKYGLENFLRDLLRPSMQDLSETQFTDDSEQFVNGEFSDEIGEDFFGFKELGLDREFGLLTSNIPLHLLQSKLSYQFSQMNKHMAKRFYEDFKEVQFPKLRKKDIPDQIGLLQPFYEDNYIKSKILYTKQLKKYQAQKLSGAPLEEPFQEVENEEDLVLIEDDDLPLKQRNNRPKIPPNGKITQIKKKFIATAFFVEKQDENEARLESIMKKHKEAALKEKEKALEQEKESTVSASKTSGIESTPLDTDEMNGIGNSADGDENGDPVPIGDENKKVETFTELQNEVVNDKTALADGPEDNNGAEKKDEITDIDGTKDTDSIDGKLKETNNNESVDDESILTKDKEADINGINDDEHDEHSVLVSIEEKDSNEKEHIDEKNEKEERETDEKEESDADEDEDKDEDEAGNDDSLF